MVTQWHFIRGQKSGTIKDLMFYCESNRVKRLQRLSFSATIKFIELENVVVS